MSWRFTHRTLSNDYKPKSNPNKAVQEATNYFTSGPGSAVTSQGLTAVKARQNAQDYADYGERPNNEDFRDVTGVFTNLNKYHRLKTNAQNEQNKLAINWRVETLEKTLESTNDKTQIRFPKVTMQR